jgi:hypothetical protein
LEGLLKGGFTQLLSVRSAGRVVQYCQTVLKNFTVHRTI